MRRHNRPLPAIFLASCLAAAPAAAEDPGEPVDWPATITRLRSEYHDNPGLTRTRDQLAIAYNNYGVSLSEQGLWELAARQLQEAILLDRDNASFKKNLANVYLNQGKEAHDGHATNEALAAVERALELDPNFAYAYALLGEIEYGRQRLKEAKAAWQRAVELDPSQPNLAERLTQVTEELPVESKFERVSQAYFDIRYAEGMDRPAGFDIRDVLLEARREVGSDFAYWPKHKTIVLMYGAEEFRKLRQETPEWVAGQFDGKIRVPVPATKMDQALVRQILFHEYTHALVQDLTGGRCPIWLNEGLAEYQGRSQGGGTVQRLRQAHAQDQLIPWAELGDHFSSSMPAEEVAFAYEQSYSIVEYLSSRYGFWRLRRLLKALEAGKAWDEAFAGEFSLKPERLEKQWRQWLPELLQKHP
jgi:hypothetical protein